MTVSAAAIVALITVVSIDWLPQCANQLNAARSTVRWAFVCSTQSGIKTNLHRKLIEYLHTYAVVVMNGTRGNDSLGGCCLTWLVSITMFVWGPVLLRKSKRISNLNACRNGPLRHGLAIIPTLPFGLSAYLPIVAISLNRLICSTYLSTSSQYPRFGLFLLWWIIYSFIFMENDLFAMPNVSTLIRHLGPQFRKESFAPFLSASAQHVVTLGW